MCKLHLILLLQICFIINVSYAQSDTASFSDNFDESDNSILLKKEWSVNVIAASRGLGISYYNGKHLTGFKKRMLEAEFVEMKHPKEIKSLNAYDNAKSYVYGKLNNLFIIRTGIGIQRIVNEKPLWGGVEVRYFYYGGFSLGITKPVYLYIINFNMPGEYDITLERYNSDEHYTDNIYGRGPFAKGFYHLKFYPGIYTKTGLNFEFGTENENLRALETGICVDFYPKPIEIMAFNKSEYYFLSFYLSFNFGKRKY